MGVFIIQNVGTKLVLSLTGTELGDRLTGEVAAQPVPVDQQWVRLEQVPGLGLFTIQTSNKDKGGNGFFTAWSFEAGAAVVYQGAAILDKEKNHYTINFAADQNLVLSIPGGKAGDAVKLSALVDKKPNANQLWAFVKV
ncbi:hypothetical protein BDR07DRAFT_1437634 [Suillus spraguei]|nr:hypothetical protein BDR07DRAFT_1437634 [Suillus spraguei]